MKLRRLELRLELQLALALGTLAASAFGAAKPEFGDAAGVRYGAAQVGFFNAYLMSKPATFDTPAKSLVGSTLFARSVTGKPPLELGALAGNPELAGEAWLTYAESLYASGQYDASRQVLANVPESVRRAHLARHENLLVRLALRGVGKAPASAAIDITAETDPFVALNLVLATQKSVEPSVTIDRLERIAKRKNYPGDVRDRARLWQGLLLAQSGEKKDALSALSEIEADTPLLADTFLAYLRVADDIHPSALAAMLQRVEARAPESPTAWELREALVRGLQKRGALAQSNEVILASSASVNATLDRLGQYLDSLARNGDPEPLAVLLPEDIRRRVNALLQRKANLRKGVELLQAWRPHVDSYYERLRDNPAQFADEIRDTFILLDKSHDTKNKHKLNELFGLALNNLVGTPPNPDDAYRLFFGLTQWEFGFEYPEGWRPVQELTKEPKRRRGRDRDAQARREEDDKEYLPEALDHANRLFGTINSKLSTMPGYLFYGEADRAKALSAGTVAQVRAIEQLIPKLDQAIRSEVVRGLKERKRLTQLWANRFAFYSATLFAQNKAGGEQPYFDLKRKLALRKGDSLTENIESIAGSPAKGKASEVEATVVWHSLKRIIEDGETRTLRADAMRLRAQLGIALFEAQMLPSAEPAVNDYSELLRTYPELVDRAETLYQLARAQDLAQRADASLATLQTLVRDFPRDPRVNEARFRIGEIQFSLSEYGFAKTAYEAILKAGDGRYGQQAEYKLGWSLFKLGDYSDALPRFISVIDRGLGAQSDGKVDAQAQERVKDTFRAVTLIFSHLSGPPDIEAFFQKAGPRPYVADIYYNLARYYLEHGRINDAASTYGYLTKHYPTDARAPVLLAELIAGARSERLAKIALDLEERFADDYAIGGTYWNQASPEARKQINAHMEPFLVELAQLYHADAQQQRTAGSYDKAIRYYGQYVATFPKAEQTPHLHFLLAEARFESGDVAGAMLDYDKTAYQYGAHNEASEAGYAALIANQKLADAEADPAERKAKLRALVTRSDRFASTFRADVRVEPVLVKASEDILMLGEAAEAVKLGEALLARRPEEATRRRTSITLAHAYFESGNFAKAEGAYQDALAMKGHPLALEKELTARLGLSVYRQAEAHKTAGNARMAINTFLRVAETAPGTDVVPNAEIDASALLLADKQWRGAIEVLERFLKTFPKHELANGIPLKLAHAYENDGQLLRAAETFEGLSHSENDGALARQLLLRAADLRLKDKRTDLAVATFESYLVRYPEPLEKASELRQQLADIAAKSKDLPTRDRWLNELVRHAKAAGSAASLRVSVLGGQAALTLGDDKGSEFDAVKLKLPLEKSLVEKRRVMETALKWYDEAGRFAVAEIATAATFKTAELYRRLAKDLLASDRPGGLNELELGQYAILLEEEAFPFEEKATALHEINYNRIQAGLYDDWVKRSLQALRMLNASRYDREEVAESYFDYELPKPKVETPGKAEAAGATAQAAAPGQSQAAAPAQPQPESVAPTTPSQGGHDAPTAGQ